MTGEAFLLDTNIIIDLFGNDPEIHHKLDNCEFAIPSVVVGELFYGARASSRVESRIDEIERFLNGKRIYSVDRKSSELYGEIKAELRRNGTPIPENDIWIAALSMQHGLILSTRDQHFQKVSKLRVEYW